MDDEQNFRNVPASNFSVAREIDAMNKTRMGSHYDINSQLADISLKVEKSIAVNIELQQKIAMLGEVVLELTSDVKKIVETLSQQESNVVSLAPKEPIAEETELGLPAVSNIPPMDFGGQEEAAERSKTSADNLVDEMRRMTEENIELVKTLRDIDLKLGKGDRSERIRKALHHAGVKE